MLFVQTRIGQGGTPFRIFKFRSMYLDAERRRAELLSESDRDGLCFKSRRDPRVTSVGRILRRTSLDELPQLLNVLRGQMSLIGPRPALPEEVAAYPRAALERLSAPAPQFLSGHSAAAICGIAGREQSVIVLAVAV